MDTTERRPSFDRGRFYATLDATRQARDMSWRDVATETGLAPSLFTRLKQGKNPDVDTFAALCAWSAASADDFIVRTRPVETPEPLAALLARFRRHSGLSPRMAVALEKTTLAMYEALRDDDGAGTSPGPARTGTGPDGFCRGCQEPAAYCTCGT